MRHELMRTAQPCSLASAPMRDTLCEKSGEWGPFRAGSNVDRSISTTSSKKRAGSSHTSGSVLRSLITRDAASA